MKYKKYTQANIILKFMQKNYNNSFLMSDFMGNRFNIFRKAPFIGYSASTVIPKLKQKGLLEIDERVLQTKTFSRIGRPMAKYKITDKGLNIKLD